MEREKKVKRKLFIKNKEVTTHGEKK